MPASIWCFSMWSKPLKEGKSKSGNLATIFKHLQTLTFISVSVVTYNTTCKSLHALRVAVSQEVEQVIY